MPRFDIVIGGAGPVGSTLALLLASRSQHPARIAIIDQSFADVIPHNSPDTPFDPRLLALNQGSRQLLEQIHAWPSTPADIHTVHVSQHKRFGRTLIRDTDMRVPRLGSVVTYDSLRLSLHTQLARSQITKIARPFQAEDNQQGYLVVQSDGTRASGFQRNYRQTALISSISASRPRPGWAYERFTSQGPLAFLPHPNDSHLYGVVWCCHPEKAQQLMALDKHRYASALQAQFGDRLGSLKVIGSRHLFPLALHAGPQQLGTRQIAIGNAAQTLHPVAGQGLNLGLRDAAQLADCLTPWLHRTCANALPPLEKSVRQRQADRWVTMGTTDFLARIFATKNPLIEHACGLGLLTTDIIPLLRKPLAHHLLYGLRS